MNETRKGSSLRRQYLLSITSVVIGMVVLVSAILISQFSQSADRITESSVQASNESLLEQLIVRGDGMTHALAKKLVNPLYDFDVSQIGKLLKAVSEQQDVEHVLLVDNNGEIVHNGDELYSLFGESSDSESIALVLQSAQPQTTIEQHRIIYAYPVLIGSEILGVVELVISRRLTNSRIETNSARLTALADEALEHNLYAALGAGLLSCLIGTMVAYRFSRNLSGPIIDLSEFATEVGQGAYGGRLDVHRQDELGELASAFNRMSENLADSHRALHQLAYHDPLTGLPNRASFADSLDAAMNDVSVAEKHGALMFIDLDDFKPINDTLGHQAGDALLCEVTRRFSSVFHEADELQKSVDDWGTDNTSKDSPCQYVLARQGGDEFTALITSDDEHFDPSVIAARLLETLRQPVSLDGNLRTVGASIGISLFPHDADDPGLLMRHSDMALYKAKESGKNKFRYFKDETSDTPAIRKASGM